MCIRDRHRILRATQGSGKGRWVAGIFALALLLAFGLFLYWPVSYTHLDVYKRQAIDGAGTAGAVREVFESSIALGLMALEKLDVDPRQMEDVEAALRQLDATRLAAQMDEGDLAAGKDHRFKPGGGRESASVLEKLRQRRQEAKAAARDEEAMQAADPESA